MRSITELLRLRHQCNLSQHEIAKSIGMPRSTVKDYLRRAKSAGLTWPLPNDVDEPTLHQRLAQARTRPSKRVRPIPHWPDVNKALQQKGVTLWLLWEEYQQRHPDGAYQYSWFTQQYRAWTQQQHLWMPQVHPVGRDLYVDFSGKTITIHQHNTSFQAQIFVTILGASQYTFCCALASQSIEDWIEGHRVAFEFYGGLPERLVPDNLKSAVIKAHRYEPQINRTYEEMAQHYQVAIVPARVRAPKDKDRGSVGG